MLDEMFDDDFLGDMDGWTKLAMNIIGQAVKDVRDWTLFIRNYESEKISHDDVHRREYVNCLKNLPECKEFFHSEWFMMLNDGSLDGPTLLMMVERELNSGEYEERRKKEKVGA